MVGLPVDFLNNLFMAQVMGRRGRSEFQDETFKESQQLSIQLNVLSLSLFVLWCFINWFPYS